MANMTMTKGGMAGRVGVLVGPGAENPGLKRESVSDSRNVTNVRALKAIVFGDSDANGKKEVQGTGSIENDGGFASIRGKIVEPPFDPLTLSMLPEVSNDVFQCSDALVTNIHGFGHLLIQRMSKDDIEDPKLTSEEVKAIDKEYVTAYNFFENCGGRASFADIREAIGKNLCSNGYSFLEIVRSPNVKGRIDLLHHLKVHQIRLCALDLAPVMVDLPRIDLIEDGRYEIRTVKTPILFRRFVQIVDSKVRFFKEFGDPRLIDNRTGDVVDPSSPPDGFNKEDHEATEIYHFKHESDRTPYGLSPFTGVLLPIYGERAAEEINFITLRNNNIPAMVLMVSGGQASTATLQRIEKFVESVADGGNFSKFILVEAEGSGQEGVDTSAVKFDFKPLVDVQTRDSMFQEYSKNNAKKIRSAVRMPPIFFGHLESYNRATAELAKKLADEQVFGPARRKFDSFINRELLPRLGVKYWKFESQGPTITDIQELLQLLGVAERTGGLSPETAVEIIGRIVGKDIPVPKGIVPDEPFSLQMAEKVKNKAAISVPTQVTALKDAASLNVADLYAFKQDILGKIEEMLSRTAQ